MNRLIEYIISAKDATAQGIESAMSRVRRFGQTVREAMTSMSTGAETKEIEEKFIKTSHVLDIVGRALDRAGVSGQDFGDAMDTLERRLNNFNKTGKGAEQLFEHFRNSMTELGLSAKQVDSGIEMLKRNMVQVGTTGAEAGKAMRGGLRDTHLIMGVMNGNVYSLARGFSFLISKVKALGLSAASISAITLALYLAVEAVKKLVGWFQDQKRKMEEIKELRFEEMVKKYEEAQESLNKSLGIQLDSIDKEVDAKKKLIDHNQKLIEQELELARLKDTDGKSGYERDSINREYDLKIAESRAKAQIAKAELEIGAGGDSASIIEETRKKVDALREDAKKQLETAKGELASLENRALGNISNYVWEQGPSSTYGSTLKARWKTETEKQGELEEWKLTDEDYKKAKDRRDKLQKTLTDLEDNLRELKNKADKAASQRLDASRKIQETAGDLNVKTQKELRAEMEDYYSEQERLGQEALAAEEAAAQERLRIQKQLDAEMLMSERNRLAEEQANLHTLVQSQRDAMNELKAATDKVNAAWGFYRDKDSLVRHNVDMEHELAARKQYESDYKSLTKGSWKDELSTAKRLNRKGEDLQLEEMFAKWRKSGLSIEQEATMRVAVAKDEQKQAQKALDEINANVASAVESVQSCAEAVNEIAAAISEGGE